MQATVLHFMTVDVHGACKWRRDQVCRGKRGTATGVQQLVILGHNVMTEFEVLINKDNWALRRIGAAERRIKYH